MGGLIRIEYLRPPDRLEHFEQHLVARLGAEDHGAVVTLLERATVKRTITVGGLTILEPGAPIVWFTFPGHAHDIGRFHDGDGRFTGYYANILTPVQGLDGDAWRTTDLFLDVWAPADGSEALVLDEDELASAEAEGSIQPETAAEARSEAARLIAAARAGTWPPAATREWTLERALTVVEPAPPPARAARPTPRSSGVRPPSAHD